MYRKGKAFLSAALLIIFSVQLLLSIKIATSQTVDTYYPTGYNLLGGTAYISGVLTHLQSDNSVYMTFQSYARQTSAQTLYAHQETTTIVGTSYYLLKLESAETAGTSLSTTMASTGRQLWGKFVYQLTGIASIPASTWTVYYRTWYSNVPENVSTNSPSSVPTGTWSNVTDAYLSDNTYAYTSTDELMQQYGDYGFNIPSTATVTKVEAGYEAYTADNEKIGITLSWNNGTSWATEYSSPPLETTDPDTVTWVDFTAATNWTVNELSNANFRTRAKTIRVGTMNDVLLDWIPVRVTYVMPLSAHADVDILIRKSDGTIRQTIATDVANSETLSTTTQILLGTYSWPADTVVDQTDYLEIDYYLDVTTAKSGVTAYLRIDDDALAIADQTRTTGRVRARASSQPVGWVTTILFALLVVFGLLFLLALKRWRKKTTVSPKTSEPLEDFSGKLKPIKPDIKKETDAFSQPFGMTHQQMIGKKMLLEIDPTSDYHKALFDFVSETRNSGEPLFIFTSVNSALHSAFSGAENVKFFLLTSKTSSLQQINEKEILLPARDLSVFLNVSVEVLKVQKEKTINMLFDNLSDIILRCGFEKTYSFMRFLLEAISPPKVTALFIFNPTAHDPMTSSSIRGLFHNQLAYSKSGPKAGAL